MTTVSGSKGSILITGASSGIGRAVAEEFLNEGWQVGLLARRADKLEEIAAGHSDAHVLPADVTDVCIGNKCCVFDGQTARCVW